MDVFCGIDRAEEHHGVATIDNTGKQLAKCRSNDDLNVYEVLLDLLAEHGDTAEVPTPIAIENSRGLLVTPLRTGIRHIFAVNPMAASCYRDRHRRADADSRARQPRWRRPLPPPRRPRRRGGGAADGCRT
ncbi:IS110 family transposase [Streptomyces sp. QHH-9511]|uniref:IS110 family transposase n=1 Tax=Streptomyces sp. QHH-9511 TaxID=2684468 RepID=UPI003FCEBECE